jgi:hypothetical protein
MAERANEGTEGAAGDIPAVDLTAQDQVDGEALYGGPDPHGETAPETPVAPPVDDRKFPVRIIEAGKHPDDFDGLEQRIEDSKVDPEDIKRAMGRVVNVWKEEWGLGASETDETPTVPKIPLFKIPGAQVPENDIPLEEPLNQRPGQVLPARHEETPPSTDSEQLQDAAPKVPREPETPREDDSEQSHLPAEEPVTDERATEHSDEGNHEDGDGEPTDARMAAPAPRSFAREHSEPAADAFDEADPPTPASRPEVGREPWNSAYDVFFGPGGNGGHVPAEGRFFNKPARIEHLQQLPIEQGKATGQQRSEAIKQIAAIGYPLDRLNKIIFRQETSRSKDTLADYTGGGKGELGIYKKHYEQSDAERLATLGHELSHSCSPLKPENADLYGGKEHQAEMASFVGQVTDQSLVTGVYIDGYHKRVLEDFKKEQAAVAHALTVGTIGQASHDRILAAGLRKAREETWAILNERGITNRQLLHDVQGRQQLALEDHNRIARLNHQTERKFVQLISNEDSATPAGIDRALVELLEGVHGLRGLRNRVAELKETFYPEEEAQKAHRRARAQRGNAHAHNH